MKAPITCFAGALCMFALAVQITACGDDDDDDKPAAEADDNSESPAVASDQTTPRDRGRGTASGGSGGSGLSQTACLAGGSRFPQASPECLGCVCETIATCGAACQELLVCTLTSCLDLLGDSVSIAACALENCAAQANSPGAAIGLTQAIAGLGACRPACLPPPPSVSEPDAATPDTSDAGTDTDAGPE